MIRLTVTRMVKKMAKTYLTTNLLNNGNLGPNCGPKSQTICIHN